MLEREFINDYLKLIRNLLDNEVQHITNGVLDHVEYAEHVGIIRGLKNAQASFSDTVKRYFPST